MHIFTKNGQMMMIKAPEDIQMYSYFTLFIALPTSVDSCEHDSIIEYSNGDGADDLWKNEEIVDTSFVFDIIRSKIPDGIRVEIKQWRILREKNPAPNAIEFRKWKVVEYRVVLFGESMPITMKSVESYKKIIEDEVERKTTGTRRGAWNASHVLPSSLLRARGW
jgi:hypothetical protein